MQLIKNRINTTPRKTFFIRTTPFKPLIDPEEILKYVHNHILNFLYIFLNFLNDILNIYNKL